MDRSEERLSNCHLWAWKQFVQRGGYIAFTKTRYAAWATDKPEWWWLPCWACGVVFQHAGSWLTFAGWWLRWRSWYHVTYAEDLNGPWEEFTPTGKNATKVIPKTTPFYVGTAKKKATNRNPDHES